MNTQTLKTANKISIEISDLKASIKCAGVIKNSIGQLGIANTKFCLVHHNLEIPIPYQLNKEILKRITDELLDELVSKEKQLENL